mgnify:CR=1 FL=1
MERRSFAADVRPSEDALSAPLHSEGSNSPPSKTQVEPGSCKRAESPVGKTQLMKRIRHGTFQHVELLHGGS